MQFFYYFCVAFQILYLMSLGVSVNSKKVGAVLAYLSFKIPNVQLRKLMKILYLIDEESVRDRCIPLTWLDYYAWAKGPVSPEVYDIKNGAFGDFVKCERGSDDKWHVFPIKKAAYLIDKDMLELSSYEQELIDDVIFRSIDKSADDLTDFTHKSGSLWRNVVDNNSIDFSENGKSDFLIDLSQLNDQEGKEIFEDARWNMEFQAKLNG